MEKRQKNDVNTVPQGSRPPDRRIEKDDPSKADELDISRGQNAEKGNTSRPENVRDAKQAAH